MANNFHDKDFISVDSLTRDDLLYLFERAAAMKELVENKQAGTSLQGRVLAPLFYEPSSRTIGSFASAMIRLGGGVIPIPSMVTSSAAKGETLSDTAKVFSASADVIVIRNPNTGSAKEAADAATVPVINAGDGLGEHPTQALLDAFTIYDTFGTLDNLHLAIMGEMKYYRPVNSLAKLMALFPTTQLSFVAAPEFALQEETRKLLKDKKVNFQEYEDPDAVLADVDALYVTRPKKEFIPEEEYERAVGRYTMTLDMARKMKEKSLIMHALPRLEEIATEVDDDPRAVYLTKQMRSGLYVRMALLELILA